MSDPKPKTVLVTGANGFIGNAVARAFVRAGWITYGLLRKQAAIHSLVAEEIIPILGSPADPSFLEELNDRKVGFDVLVSTTEDLNNYVPHYKDIISLFRAIATTSNAAGIRPLVMFTSGCKDYGPMDKLANSPNLSPHTEESPLNPPSVLSKRTEYAIKTFENTDLFDTIVLRPTNVHGLTSSYYGAFFDIASAAKKKGVLEFTDEPKTIAQSLHVDDCGEAYVQLASHSNREVVKGQCYNISSYRYETLEEIALALVEEYEIPGGVTFVPVKYEGEMPAEKMVTGFSQWTGSEKLRRDTGWTDKKALFSKGLHRYRLAYELASLNGHTAFPFWETDAKRT